MEGDECKKKENKMTLDNNVRCTVGLSYDCSNGRNSADPENPAKRGKQGIITIPRRDKGEARSWSQRGPSKEKCPVNQE